MAARFAEYPDAVRRRVRLAETLRFDLTGDLGYRYPGSEDPDAATRELAEVCRARFAEPLRPTARPTARPHAAARLEQELRIIDKLGLSGFFLLHHEILELAREVAVEVRGPDSARALLPPGRGRGSSVSSIVCYLTGLSHIDPVGNGLRSAGSCTPASTGLPDIDIDFPRDIREVLIARVPEHYGRDRAALVAAFPTFRARGAIRELGKALGLPAGEIERVARASDGWGGDGTSPRTSDVLGPSAASTPLGVARTPRRRGVRAAPAPLPAPRRDGDRHTAPDRLLPDRARGDGGPADRAVGQGLLRGRRLPEDRPARAGDALRGRAVRRDDRQHPRRADRPLAHPVRRPRDVPGDPPRGHRRRLSDREPRADADRCGARSPRASTTSRSRSRSCGPARSRAAPSTPTSNAASALRDDPDYEVPYPHPSLRGRAAGDARHDRLPGPGDRGRQRVRRLHRRRGRGPAPRDEPQALPGGDGEPPRAVRRRRPPARRRRPREARARLGDGRRASPASASPRPTAPPSACSPTSRHGCASTTPPSSSARC